jgi:hypothetical protein
VVKLIQVFEDFLAKLRETPGDKRFHLNMVGCYAQDCHAAVVFFHEVGKGRVLLVIGKGDAQDIRLTVDIGDKCATA